MVQRPEADTGRSVDAVVFDLDGVLIDSEELWDHARRRLAADAGLPWPADATRAMQGMSTPEWSRYLVETVGVPGTDADVALATINRMAGEYARTLPLLPGAVAAVKRLAARWPLGLASSSPRRLIDSVLEVADLTTQFQVSVSTEEVAAGKPSPLVYETVVERLGAAPDRTVAIEDSSNGLRSAAAAGLLVIALPNRAFPPAPDALALAVVQIETLDELTPELVESAATRAKASSGGA
jgi:HAD superfamily hydrolase (TIGR01509 family)